MQKINIKEQVKCSIRAPRGARHQKYTIHAYFTIFCKPHHWKNITLDESTSRNYHILEQTFLRRRTMERSIMHVDCDKFYASVECLHHPEARDKPVVVGGDPEQRHGIVLTKMKLPSNTGSRPGKPSGRPNGNAPAYHLSAEFSTVCPILPSGAGNPAGVYEPVRAIWH